MRFDIPFMEPQNVGIFRNPVLRRSTNESKQNEGVSLNSVDESEGSKISVRECVGKTKKRMLSKNKDWLQKKRHFRESKLIKLSYQGEFYNG
tara:strand:+ start:213 stop:488 length:276 start_codon:yes stop_codon:yes gene_type:complete